MKNMWLKDIVGDGYSEEMDTKVATHLGTNFVSKAEFNATNEEAKTAKAQIATLTGQLDELKKVDPAKLQETITQLQEKNAADAAAFADQAKQIKLDYATQARLAQAGAVNVKAVMALLDQSKISMDGDNLIGLDDQLTALKKNEAWAFTNVPNQTSHARTPITKTPEGGDGGGDEAGVGANDATMNAFFRGKTGDEE